MGSGAKPLNNKEAIASTKRSCASHASRCEHGYSAKPSKEAMFGATTVPKNRKKARVDSSETTDKRRLDLPGGSRQQFWGESESSSSSTISVSDSEDIKVTTPINTTPPTEAKLRKPNPQQTEDIKKWGTKQQFLDSHSVGALEVCCGCARMTKELRAAGFDAVGIDYNRNKDKPESKSYVELDLSKPWGLAEMYKLIKSKRVKLTFSAPPCGSASAARLIRRKNGPDPKPLRSKRYPDGLPNLSFTDRERVSTANQLYKMAADLAFFCEQQGISWVIENPTNSLMWQTSPFTELYRKLRAMGSEPKWSDMQMCMHGGDRDKRTSLLYGGPVDIQELSVLCVHNHTHKPWGLTKTPGTLWATAEERNYPRTFCKRVAIFFAKALIPKGVKRKATELQKEEDGKHWAGKQPRREHKDLISEFKEILNFTGATSSQMKAAEDEKSKFPVQCGDVQITNVAKVLDDEPEIGGDGSKHKGRIGVYWTKEEFVHLAKQLTHPLDEHVRVPVSLAQVIYDWAWMGPEGIKHKRKNNLAYYERRAQELQKEEDELQAKLMPEVREVIKGKRILLFKEMLKDIHYDDMSVVELLTLGVRIVGLCENTGIWTNTDDKLPKTNVRHLWASAKQAQADCMNHSHQKDDELADDVWKLTAGKDGEVDSGVLKGPFTPKEISEQVGSLWIPARRFGIKQGAKIRPVDDFSQYGINRAFGSEQKLAIMGIDHVISWSRALLHAHDSKLVKVLDSNGQEWVTRPHPSWTQESWSSLRGRVADLKNAYKQMAVAPEHKSFNVVAVYDPGQRQTKLFRAISLMFGQTAAVYAFLRISRAISTIGTKLFSLFLVEYFDDFTQVEAEIMGDSAQVSFEGLLKLIGWRVADTEEKRKPSQVSFLSLGVQVDFDKSKEKLIILKPKEGRIKSIVELAKKILKQDKMGFEEALSLKGKLQFAEGQLFFRVTAAICRLLSKWASTGGVRPLTEEMRVALRAIESLLYMAGPRLVESIHLEMPIIVFTDGACEPRGTSIGGVLLIPGMQPQAFGAMLREEAAMRLATKKGQRQVIGQAEILPVLVAKTIWAEELSNRKVIYFIDNDSARLALIKGYSPVLTSLKLIMSCAFEDAQLRSSPWYARVPTKSNIADEPSRMRKDNLLKLGAKIVRPYINDKYSWFADVLE